MSTDGEMETTERTDSTPQRSRRTMSIASILEKNKVEVGSVSTPVGNKAGWEYSNKVKKVSRSEVDTPKKIDREKPRRISVKCELVLWRLFTLVGMLLVWGVVLVPVLLSGSQSAFEKEHNITINQQLLLKINLTGEMKITCPEHYIFSPVAKTCQPVCGQWNSAGDACYYIERVVFALIAIIGIITGIVALITWLCSFSTWQFQHHPIFMAIIVNLLQSVSIGIIDIPGRYYFTCGGVDIDNLTLENNPTIRTQILGAIIHSLALSNRIWFFVALTYILLRIWFPLRDFFNTNRKKIILIIIEMITCVLIPILTEVVTFSTGARYINSSKIALLVSDNRLLSAVFGFVPHALIASLTMTIILLIIYKIRSQVIINNTKILPIEKRLLFFSAIYFVLTVIVALSVSIHLVIDSNLEYQRDEYRSTITLNSILHPTNSSFAGTNFTVSSLLPLEDRLRITSTSAPLLIYLSGASNRMMFIVVFAVTYINLLSLSKLKSFFKTQPKVTHKPSNKVYSNSNTK